MKRGNGSADAAELFAQSKYSHDPMCDSSGFFPPDDCDDCDLIAKVRDDVAQRVYSLCTHTKHLRSAPCIHDEIAAAVRGES